MEIRHENYQLPVPFLGRSCHPCICHRIISYTLLNFFPIFPCFLSTYKCHFFPVSITYSLSSPSHGLSDHRLFPFLSVLLPQPPPPVSSSPPSLPPIPSPWVRQLTITYCGLNAMFTADLMCNVKSDCMKFLPKSYKSFNTLCTHKLKEQKWGLPTP